MREHVHWEDDVPEVRAAAAAVAARAHDRRGRRAPPSCCCPRATGCARSTWPRPAAAGPHRRCTVRRAPHVVVIPTGDEVAPARRATRRPASSLDTNSLMLAAQAREAGCTASSRSPIVPDDPDADRAPRVRDGRGARPTS